MRDPHLAGIDPRHIIDAGSKDRLAQRDPRSCCRSPPPGDQFEKVARFLGDTLSLRPDPSAMIGCAAQMVTRLSGGLATWARRLDFAPYRLRVVGTAGSGKTQLALAEYCAAIDAGLRPLYVCFNRPLADHIERLVPAGGRVATFHMLGDAFLRARGITPDYAAPDVWGEMETALATATLPETWKYDVLIVDEGQDFSSRLARHPAAHAEGGRPRHLARRPDAEPVRPRDGAAAGLGDAAFAHQLPQPAPDRRHAGRRSATRAQPVEAASPFDGADIEALVYPEGDTAAMIAQTKHAITLCLAAGFARQDIAIASFRGRENSALLGLDTLGDAHTLKSFTGAYDLFGNPVFREGGLLAESVYRFKGQSAPAVIFTEIDFEEIDELVFRKLFVGMTRARLKLVLVLSERAAAQLLERI